MMPNEVGYNGKVEGDVIVTKADAVINWIRSHSVWPMPMGLACCAIELMASAASRYDISRFGMEVMRFSPRQSDCMIVAGTVTYKMAEVVRRIYDQMGDPKWVVAMGACASTGGGFGGSQGERRAESLAQSGRFDDAAGAYIGLAVAEIGPERDRLCVRDREHGRRILGHREILAQDVPNPNDRRVVFWQC